MKEIEKEGKTVTIAVENGLEELGLRRDQVEVQVLAEAAAGFLGIGAKPARVHIREKRWGEEGTASEKSAPKHKHAEHTAPSVRRTPRSRPQPKPQVQTPAEVEPQQEREAPRPQKTAAAKVDTAKAIAEAESVVSKILSLAEVTDAKVKAVWDAEQERVRVEVETDDGGLVIGKGGRTIEALQFLVTVIVGRRVGVPTAVQVDSQGYWGKLESRIISEAENAVKEVQRTGSPFRFEPMDAAMRRLIHRRLADHPDVVTASEGEGSWRKVVLKPRKA